MKGKYLRQNLENAVLTFSLSDCNPLLADIPPPPPPPKNLWMLALIILMNFIGKNLFDFLHVAVVIGWFSR